MSWLMTRPILMFIRENMANLLHFCHHGDTMCHPNSSDGQASLTHDKVATYTAQFVVLCLIFHLCLTTVYDTMILFKLFGGVTCNCCPSLYRWTLP